MNPRALPKTALIAIAVAAIFLVNSTAQATLFVWQASCVSENWYACCEDPAGNYNNWWFGPYPMCPSFPGAADDVEVNGSAVYLAMSANIWSFHSAGVFQLYDSGLAVHTTATYDGPFIWHAGSLVTGTFNINDTLELRTTGGKQLAAATLNVNGGALAAVTSDITLNMDNHALIDIAPLGVFEVQTDSTIQVTPGSMVGADGVHVRGEFRKVLSTGDLNITTPFNNDGVVKVLTGTLHLDDGYGSSTGNFEVPTGSILETRNYKFSPGTTITGDGLVRLPSIGFLIVDTGATVTANNVEINSFSQLRGAGELRIANSFNWLGGAMVTPGVGATTVLAGATMTLSGDDYKLLGTRTLNNAGSAVWSGAGPFYMTGSDGPPVFNNLAGGTFDIQTDADMDAICCGYSGIVNNAGTYKKTVGTSETAFGGEFHNTGTVDIRTGSLNFYQYSQTAGTTKLSGGALSASAFNPFTFDGGLLEGSVGIGAYIQNNGGEVRPGGTSAGTMTFVDPLGYFTQTSGGTLSIDLGGLTPGTQHDQMAIAEFATLAGTLHVSLIDGFVPSDGNEFVILTAYQVFGAFDTITLSGFPSYLTVEAIYSSNSVKLRIHSVGCTTCKGDMNADGKLNGKDIQALVGCVLTGSATGPCACADMDGNAVVNATDASLFATKLLTDSDNLCP